MSFADEDLTQDAFLGGRVTLWQPRRGYRAGIDPVLLAAWCPAMPGQSVLDLGAGAGAACLCLAARVPNLRLWAVERQADYAALLDRNAQANGVAVAVAVADLADLPAGLRALRFDHVLMNPPYFPVGRTPATDPGREGGRGADTALGAWIDVAARRLQPGGRLSAVIAAAQVPGFLAACTGRLGGVDLLPVVPRQGRDARLALVSARKGGRGVFRLRAPLVLHEGAAHAGDRESYTAQVQALLREAAPLP